jgi:hypothetical protein
MAYKSDHERNRQIERLAIIGLSMFAVLLILLTVGMFFYEIR